MSHYHYDKESEMVGAIDVDNTVSRHHSHIHFKPTIVFDHLRTKVKRKTKRSSNNSLNEAPAFAIDDNNNNNNNNNHHMLQRSSHDHDKFETKTTLVTCRSQPNITQTVSDQPFDHNHEENHPSIEREKDEDIIEPIQFQLSPIELDIDNNKNNKSKSKLNKITKAPSDVNNQTNTKKRRQIARRTGFQIRDEDFNHIFNELPSDEQLIVAYPCSWRKDIFMHGRMFLSVNYLCFYTCFFKWEESLSIAYKDIISVTREKSAKVLPNAIKLRTKNREQFLFASYIPRERVFIAIYRLWQNALLEKPLDYQQLRSIVFADQMSIDGSSGDSEESIVLDNNNERSSKNSLQSQSSSPIPLGNLIESAPSFIKPDERIIESLSSSEPTCPCESHLNRTYADQIFSYHVDKLFELTYGDNSFTRNYHDSQKLTDYTIGEWHMNKETRKRERLVTYKTVTQSIFGTNTISCSEKQILEVDKPQSMYVINTEVFNEGMKYTDAFFVATRVCMWQRDAKTSSLRITAEVKYIKNVNGIAKSFIEKNCNSNIEDSINNLIRRLDNHQATINKSKHHQRKKKEHQINIDQNIINPLLNNNQTKTITGKGYFFDIILFIGILLFILHICLCYQLYSIDQALFNIDQSCLDKCRKVCLSKK